MNSHPAPDTIPISALNALEYCPRRFYYQFVQADMLVNEFVLEGAIIHRRAHQPGVQTIAGLPQTTRLYLYSEALHLSGFADVIEERDGLSIPIEYKRGKQGSWLNDAIQLCAQALCLEERLVDHMSEAGSNGIDDREKNERPPGVVLLSYGYIYYAGSRRRVRVNFTADLRHQTHAAIAQALLIAAREQVPPPLDATLAHCCLHCSLRPLCLPDEVKQLRASEKGA